MKESLGNAVIYNIVIVFVIVFIGLFVTSTTYSKGYKIKNRMIKIIEQDYQNGENETAMMSHIEDELSNLGYRISSGTCKTRTTSNNSLSVEKYSSKKYKVCFEKLQRTSSSGSSTSYAVNGVYYRVTAYMYLDIPLINQFAEFPIYGETKTFTIGLTS